MPNIRTQHDWATRHLREGEEWIESYWKSRNDPHRIFLAEEISKLAPVNKILEIGCASGPNLYQMAKKFPEAELKGIDINPVAVEKGNKWLKEEGLTNVQLEVGRAQELNRFSDGSFDVVFTDAVLIYVSPSEIKQVIREMLRVSRAVVLNEWHIFNKTRATILHCYHYLRLQFAHVQRESDDYSFWPKSSALGFYVGHWVRNYRELFEEFVSNKNIIVTKLPKDLWKDASWQRWGALVKVTQ